MHWQYTAYVLPLAIAATISAGLAVFTWRRRPAPGATPLAWLMLAAAEWSLGYTLELSSANLSAKVWWSQVQFLGMTLAPMLLLAFALHYTGRERWLSRRNLALLAVEPLVTLLLVWTNQLHGLVWKDVRLDMSGPFLVLNWTYSTWFWINTAYSYALVVLSMVLIVQAFIGSAHPYRGQAGGLLVSILVPWLVSMLYVFGLGPFPSLDLTPFAFTVTGLAIAASLFHFRLLDIVPVARATIIEGMSDAVIVLDAQGRIVDLNPAAAWILGRVVSEVIGQPAAQILSGRPDLVEHYRDVPEAEAEIVLGEGEEQRTYDLRISPLHDQLGRLTGRLVVLRDISERKRAEEALRESKQLFEKTFASLRDAVFIVDADTVQILDCNSAACEIFGYSREEMLGSTTTFLHVDEATLEEFRDQLYPAVQEKGLLFLPEFRMKRKDGAIFPTEHSVMPLEDEQGRRIGWVSVVRDITERKQAEEALRRRAEEMAALHATGLDITASHNLPTLLQAIVERAARLLNAPSGGLYLCVPDQQEVRCVVSYNTVRDYTGTVLNYGEGAAGTVAVTGKPLIIDDYRTWPGRAAVYEKEQPFIAILSAPMIWQGQVTGVIHVLHDVENRRFTQADLELLTLFAQQAAIAVENAQLFEAMQQQSERLAQTLVASESLHRGLEPEQVLQHIAQGVVGLGFRRAVINVCQSEGELVRVRAVAGLEGLERERLMGATYHWSDFQTLMQERFRIGRSYLIRQGEVNWGKDFQGVVVTPMSIDRGPGYWRPEDILLVPLLGTHGELVGLLSVDEPVDGLLPHLNIIRMLEAFANQAAIAIENARLFEALQRRAQEAETLRQAGAAVVATLRQDETIQRILEQLAHVVPYDSASVQLLRDGYMEIVGGRGFSDPAAVIGLRFPVPADNPNTVVVQQRRPYILSDAPATHSPFRDAPHSHIRSWLGVPLIVHDRVIGMLAVDSTQPNYFTCDHIRLAAAFADQVAIAIENARLYAEVQRLAITDELTGLYNRRGFCELGRREVERARRFGRPLTAIMSDLDDLKQVNDAYGHVIGDQVLIGVAAACRQELREVDLLGRYGGDEFTVLLPETDLDGAWQVAQRLRQRLARTAIDTDRGPMTITLSLGVTTLDEEHTDLEALLDRVDQALYAAKQAGRNRVCTWPP